MAAENDYQRLCWAGWTVADGPTPAGWEVRGTNGENAVRATGATRAEAWRRARRQAEAVMPPPRRLKRPADVPRLTAPALDAALRAADAAPRLPFARLTWLTLAVLATAAAAEAVRIIVLAQ